MVGGYGGTQALTVGIGEDEVADSERGVKDVEDGEGGIAREGYGVAGGVGVEAVDGDLAVSDGREGVGEGDGVGRGGGEVETDVVAGGGGGDME